MVSNPMAIPLSCQHLLRLPVMRIRVGVGAFLFAFVIGYCSIASAQTSDIRPVHDPRIIQCGDYFYCFCTGIGIPIRRSKDLINWQYVGNVFPDPPTWAKKEYPNARYFWAPDISYFSGTYHLYYALSRFGRNDSRIALATNPTLDPKDRNYHWTDAGKVIETHPKDATHPGDNWNAIDPAIAFDADKHPWLVMGSFWDGIKMRRIDPATGLVSTTDSKLYSLARRAKPDALEAGYIFHHGAYYYLFVSFDYCCRGTNSTYKIAVGRSNEITSPYVDEANKAMLDGGGTVILASHDNVIGPGHCGVFSAQGREFLVHHFYDSSDYGRPTLQIQPIAWGADGWLTVGHPIATTAPSTTRP
jgi:arabinan endo-1,5-alpha-L-arabinosidase